MLLLCLPIKMYDSSMKWSLVDPDLMRQFGDLKASLQSATIYSVHLP